MKAFEAIILASVIAGSGFVATVVQAQITPETVPVGRLGNPPDPLTGFGAVGYFYRIGKTEVTHSEYAAFLNAVAASADPNALYDIQMELDPLGGIVRSLGSPFVYSVKAGFENLPVNFVTWLDAARFANWLHNGQPSGGQDPSTTEDGAYDLSVPDPARNATRRPQARWVLPSNEEWYKAAYHQPASAGGDGDGYWLYATRSNSVPVDEAPPGGDESANFADAVGRPTETGAYGSAESFFATRDQAGNVFEWTETASSSIRIARGGSYQRQESSLRATSFAPFVPTGGGAELGFRVAFIPPVSFGLPIRALGEATLAQSVDDELVVANIGPSLQDGVAFETFELTGGLCVRTAALCLDDDNQTVVELAAMGTLMQQQGELEFGQMKIDADTDPAVVEADFPVLGVGKGVNIEVCNHIPNGGDTVLAATTYTSSGTFEEVATIPKDSCVDEVDWLDFGSDSKGFRLLFESDVAITVPGIGTVTANCLIVRPDSLQCAQLSTFEIRLQNVSELTILDAPIQIFSRFHHVLGGVDLEPSIDGLTVANFDPDGESGILVELERADDFRIRWEDFGPAGTIPVGAALELTTTVSAGGVAGQDIIQALMATALDRLTVETDFSPLLATDHKLEVYDDDRLVGTVMGPSATSAGVGGIDGAVVWPVAAQSVNRGSAFGLVLNWSEDVMIETAGSMILIGDELRVFAENPEERVDYLETFALRASGIPKIRIIDESSVELAVSGDCNANGVDDGLDIAAGTSEDVNSNGFPDECEVGEVVWQFSGTAQGGEVSATITGFSATCTVTVATLAGQTADAVAASLAAAVNSDNCLAAQGISAVVSGSTVTIQGFTLDHGGVTTQITDPGIRHSMPVVSIPTVSHVGLALLTLILLAMGVSRLQKLSR